MFVMSRIALFLLLLVVILYPANARIFPEDLSPLARNLTLARAAAHPHAGRWLPAPATWYGGANADGSDGGACGYKQLFNTPYGSNIAAGSSMLFKTGLGCGNCYQVKCSEAFCSGRPVDIVITDECPGGPCAGRIHFDLSGTAVGNMAMPGQADALRNRGELNIEYRRIPCRYSTGVGFQIDEGSGGYWFTVAIKYLGGPGQVSSIELQEAGSADWHPMTHNWGSHWSAQSNSGRAFRAPFSIRLTAAETGRKLVARDVIPAGWRPTATYFANVNF